MRKNVLRVAAMTLCTASIITMGAICSATNVKAYEFVPVDYYLVEPFSIEEYVPATIDAIVVTEETIEETQPEYTYLGDFVSTAYCSCSKCCGKWSGGPTKSGVMPQPNHTIAVDTSVIPMGTHVIINGQEYVAEDTGSGIKGNRIDIYYNSHSAALQWGRRTVEVYLVN